MLFYLSNESKYEKQDLLVGEAADQPDYGLEEQSCICFGSFSTFLLNAGKKRWKCWQVLGCVSLVLGLCSTNSLDVL